MNAKSVICGCCAIPTDKGREVSVLERPLIWLGNQYTCKNCGNSVVALICGSPLYDGDKTYNIIRDKGVDYDID